MLRALLLGALVACALSVSASRPVSAADPSSQSASFSPSATPAPSGALIDPLDPRGGASASHVGAPFLALVFVIGLGAVSAVATVIFVRVTRRA